MRWGSQCNGFNAALKTQNTAEVVRLEVHRERETETETERERDRDRDRETETERDRDRYY